MSTHGPVTPKECAHTIADYIYANALANKELKSLAATIGYKLSFFSPTQTIRLRHELGCLYAFMGSLAIDILHPEYPDIPEGTIEELKGLYVTKLLKWLPESQDPRYAERRDAWEPLFHDPENPDILGLAESFYRFLTETSCDEGRRAMLILRFNNYLRLFFSTFQQYMGDIIYDSDISDDNKAVEVEASSATIYRLGCTCLRKGEYDKAISYLTKVIEINPSDASCYNSRGMAYYLKDHYDKAISDFSKAIEENPMDPKAYVNRGATYLSIGEYDQAISDFNRAIEIDPKDDLAYANRGQAYYRKEDYDKAWEDVHTAEVLGHQIQPALLKILREASGREK